MREVLSDESDDTSRAAITNLISDKENFIAGTENRFRLVLRSRDQEFFYKYIQREGGVKELPTEIVLSDSQANIRDNALFLKKKLTESCSKDEVRKLAAYIVQKCYLVVVSTPDEESAFRIFSVLNDRGMQLSNADILKAEIIGEIPEQNRKNTPENGKIKKRNLALIISILFSLA